MLSDLSQRSQTNISASQKRRTIFDFIVLFFKGMAMGVADVIPGISGGTMALITGIYEEWILAIRSFDLTFMKHLFEGRFKAAFASLAWPFLMAVGAGLLCAIVVLSGILTYLLETFPDRVYGFFFGLICATIPMIAAVNKAWRWQDVLLTVITALSSFYLVAMVPVSTPHEPWFIFICGALAICAMILPGISGSFILLILGQYRYVMEAIHEREWSTMIIFGMGVGIGLLSFVRILGWLFKRYHNPMIAVIVGFVAGSLNKIWPWKTTMSTTTSSGEVLEAGFINHFPSLNTETYIVFSLMAFGALLAWVLERSHKDSQAL